MKELVLTIEDLNVVYGTKTVLEIEKLMVYQHERIGIIGNNGEGKSTLLKAIEGRLPEGKGSVNAQIEFSYFDQLNHTEKPMNAEVNEEILSRFSVPDYSIEKMSGGEKAKYNLAHILSEYKEGLILDEPTTHLDQRSISYLIEELRFFYGTLLFVSHDRYFLNELATKIWEISDGRVKEYSGNFEDYRRQKDLEVMEKKKTYENYENQKKSLEKSIEKRKQQVDKLTQNRKKNTKKQIKPSRLSSSKQKDTVQKSIQKNVKTLEKRLSGLEVVTSEGNEKHISFPKTKFEMLHNDFPIKGDKVTLVNENKVLVEDVDFQFEKGKKIAIIGENGSGKTTFLDAILEKKEGISVSSKAVISVYEQLAYQLNHNESVITYLMNQTDYKEAVVRSILHKIGFTQNELTKRYNVLSGGERTRVSLALTMLRPSNILILDEPTNFVDLRTIEALESLIQSYPGTVLFTSHDKNFIQNTAEVVYEISNKKIVRINN